MAEQVDSITLQRAPHFAQQLALPQLGVLCDQMGLTLGEAQVGYTLLLAEALSCCSMEDRRAVVQDLPEVLFQLTQECEQSRGPSGSLFRRP